MSKKKIFLLLFIAFLIGLTFIKTTTINMNSLGTNLFKKISIEKDNPVRAEVVLLESDEIRILPGETYQINVYFYPENTTNQSVTYSSDNNTIASVNEDGIITGESIGYTTIFVYIDDTKETKEISVEVYEEETPTESVIIEIDTPMPEVGETAPKLETHYFATEEKWKNITDNKTLTDTDKIEWNKKYKYEISIYPGNNDEYSRVAEYNNTKYLLNSPYYLRHEIWEDYEMYEMDEGNIYEEHIFRYVYYFYFGETEEKYLISTGNAIIPERNIPTKNEEIQILNPVISSSIQDKSETWMDARGSEVIYHSGKEDIFYIYSLVLVAENNFTFKEDFKVINRNSLENLVQEKTIILQDNTVVYFTAIYRISNKEIGVEIPGPIIYTHPIYGTNTSDITINEQAWVNLTDHKIMTEEDYFEQDKLYSYSINYDFQNESTIFPSNQLKTNQYFIDGGSNISNNNITGSAEFYTGNKNDAPNKESIELEIDNPILNHKYPTAKNNDSIEIIEEKWVNLTDNKEMDSNDIFEENKKYEYQLKYNTTYDSMNLLNTFNTSQYLLGIKQKNAPQIGLENEIKAVFYFGEKENLKISTNEVTIKDFIQPKIGNTITSPTVVLKDNLVSYEKNWTSRDYPSNTNENVVSENSTFLTNKYYTYQLKLMADIGYTFEDDFEVKIDSNIHYNNLTITRNNTNNEITLLIKFALISDSFTSIQIKDQTKTLEIEDQTTLSVITEPNTSILDIITWSVSNSEMATINQEGVLLAKKIGTVIVTARTETGLEANCIVTIIGKQVKSISLNEEEKEMFVGDQGKLIATITPNDATNTELEWISSDDKIVKVDQNGNITAKKKGTATITVKSSNNKQATCIVTVREIEVAEVILNKSKLILEEEAEETLVSAILPLNATHKEVTWISKNNEIATVDENGKVTGIKEGTTEVTAKSNNNIEASCIVVITKKKIPLEEIQLEEESITIEQEERKKINVIFTPSNTTENNLVWESLDENIAIVDQDGNVTGVNTGTTRIIIYAQNNISLNCTVTVKERTILPTSIQLNTNKLTLEEEEKEELKVTFSPNNTNSKEITWESSNSAIASVDEFGKVTGVSEGEVTITATTKNNKKATCTVTVVKKNEMKILYTTHVQTYGWQDYVANGEMAGTSGEAKRLEGIKIKLENAPYEGNVLYRTHIQTFGWEKEFKKNDEMSGTSGLAKRLEAIEIKLDGEISNHYDIYYRVHAQTYGWLGWARNGERAGTAGYAKRLEGIEIKLVSKKESFEEYGEIDSFIESQIEYTTHVQKYGWQNYVTEGVMAGTSGQALRLEAIKIKLSNPHYEGDILYRTHIQSFGWEKDFKKNDEASGTSGLAKRLEAIEIKLTGEMESHYDIFYRVHAQSFGWLGWAKNGESAGTAGYAKRLEGIEIKLFPKNKAPNEYQYSQIPSFQRNYTSVTRRLNDCSAQAFSNVEEKNVTTDYYDHVNWTFSTGINYSSNTCYVTYRSSDSNVATVDNDGFIKANKQGTVDIYECINDTKSHTEVLCYKGKLNVISSEIDQCDEEGMIFANKVKNNYWYLDGYEYAYLYPEVLDWYDHQLLQFDSRYIKKENDQFIMSEDTNEYYDDDNSEIHNSFLMNPISCSEIRRYKMKVIDDKLSISLGDKEYIFTKRTSKKEVEATLSTKVNNVEIEQSQTKTVKINYSPKFINIYNLNITSSNSSIASCQRLSGEKGNIILTCTGKKEGEATIQVQEVNGQSSASFQIEVYKVNIPVTGINLNKTSISLEKGKYETLQATILPENADNKGMIWESRDSTIASVDQNGKVTALKKGTTIISATTLDGSIKANCIVSVTNPPLTVSASPAIVYSCGSSGCMEYMEIEIKASGGSGTYTYNYDVYRNDIYIGTYTTKKIQLRKLSGVYRIDYKVTDSDQEEVIGTTTTTMSF